MLYPADPIRHSEALHHGLHVVKRETDAEWCVEQIVTSLQECKSFLFMDSFDPQSFVVLTEWQCPYTKQRVLEVQAAYSPNGNAMVKYSADIDAIGREAGCSRIEFSSPREGFKRLAGRHGYEPVCVTYRKML